VRQNEERIMSSLPRETARGQVRTVSMAWQSGCKSPWLNQRREASLNWLALGLLLAAWNASDDDSAARTPRRPAALRGYSSVSVRAAALHAPDADREYLSKGHKSVNVL
jgi:hypothetical protein